jgi:hypothetical protein
MKKINIGNEIKIYSQASNFFFRKYRSSKFILNGFAFFLLAASSAGCGKVGDPVPPARTIKATTQQLEARQQGARILVTFPRPARNPNLGGVTRADVFRLTEDANAPAALPIEVFSDKARLVGTVRGGQLYNSGPFVAYEDPLEATDTSLTARRYRYAVRFFDENGRPSPFSNYALAYPTPGVAETPSGLTSTLSQDALTLRWNGPAKNIDGSATGTTAFNIYRRSKGDAFDGPLNPTPVTQTTFADTRFSFETEYEYVVRAVSFYRGEPIESANSEVLSLKPVDTFPPAPPVNLTGASAAGIVNLFFPSGPERDIKGYFIYRTEIGGTGEAVKLTPNPVTQTTFQDRRGVAGKTYRYQVSAIDVFGNESGKSDPVEVEVLP